jgi:hypothetical protein
MNETLHTPGDIHTYSFKTRGARHVSGRGFEKCNSQRTIIHRVVGNKAPISNRDKLTATIGRWGGNSATKSEKQKKKISCVVAVRVSVVVVVVGRGKGFGNVGQSDQLHGQGKSLSFLFGWRT